MVTAIVPAYNAEKTISQLIKRASKFCDRIIVVDDGSKDKTFPRAKSTRKAQVIRLPINMGKAHALRVGLSQCRDNKVVFIDSDLQHLPEEIPDLLKKLKKNSCDICIGSRRLGKHDKMPFHRRASNRIVTLLTNLLTGYRVTDAQSGFRAFGPKALKRLTWKGTNYDIEVENLIEASQKKLKVCEVPISTIYSGQVSYIHSLRHTVGLVKIVLRTIFSRQ